MRIHKISLLVIAGLFLIARTVSNAEIVDKVVEPVGSEGRYRLNILIIGNSLSEVVINRLKQITADECNFYRPLPAPGNLLTPKILSAKTWHGVLLCREPGLLAPEAYANLLLVDARQLQANKLVGAWVSLASGQDDDRSVRYNDVVRAALKHSGLAIADVPGALMSQHETAGDRADSSPLDDVDICAGAIAHSLRQVLLQRSTLWTELPLRTDRDPQKLLLDSLLLKTPMQLPEANGTTSTIYRAEAGQWQFNLHSFIAFHENKFWAIWSSGYQDEDGPSQIVRYATSLNGHDWSKSSLLVDDPDGPDGPIRWMANGLYVENGRLYALVNRNEGSQIGIPWLNAKLFRLEWTGSTWKAEDKPFADDCLVYYPPLKVAGRDLLIWRNSRGHFLTAFKTPEEVQWHKAQIPGPFPDYRLSETSHYVDNEGIVHLIIRDQGRTGYLYHAVSLDDGGTWTIPVKTNYPDATSKNFSGRLSNGIFYLISNPKQDRPRERDPLVISFSQDGWTFDRPLALRKNAPPLRYPGRAKGSFSFQYAHGIEHDGKFWVIYATNKEDIEITSFEISDFPN